MKLFLANESIFIIGERRKFVKGKVGEQESRRAGKQESRGGDSELDMNGEMR